MYMEAETVSMLVWGFSIVMALCLGTLALIWLKKKNNSLIWFVIQLAFLTMAFIRFIDLLLRRPQTPEFMQSEMNSLSLGVIGIFWAAGMICMLVGIWSLNRKKEPYV